MKTLTFFLLIAAPIFLFAQDVDYDKIIPPDDAIGISLQDRLVQLAWKNYPANQMLEHQVLIANEEIKQSQLGYLKPVSLNFNYGEANINSKFQQGFFPIYNMSVSINVGEILTTPSVVRAARERQKIAELTVDRQKLFIRAELIRRYQEYLQKVELFKILAQNQEDAYTSYLSFTQKFKAGEIALESYNEVLMSYSKAQEQKIKAESQVIIARSNVEELIGMPLDEVEK